MKRINNKIIAMVLLLFIAAQGITSKTIDVKPVSIEEQQQAKDSKIKLFKQLGLGKNFDIPNYIEKRDKYYHLTSSAAKENDIDIRLIEAVIICESRWSEKAVSKENACGLMQIIDGPFEAERNIRAGTAILANYIKKCDDDLLMGLTAYNMGFAGAQRKGKPNAYAYRVLKMWFYLNYINS